MISRCKDRSWRLLRANVKAQSSGVEIKDGELEGSQQGQIAFAGRVGMDGWSFRPEQPDFGGDKGGEDVRLPISSTSQM
jgi:hypothetical protein